MTTPLSSAVEEDEDPFDVDEFVLRIGRLVRERGWAEIARSGGLTRAPSLFLTMSEFVDDNASRNSMHDTATI